MTRREAVQRIVALSDDVPSVDEVTRLLAIRCETYPHGFIRNRRCAWCGKPQGETDGR
jgi:hypothetical protein